MNSTTSILSVFFVLAFSAINGTTAEPERFVMMQNEVAPLPKDNTVSIASSFDEIEFRLASLGADPASFDALASSNDDVKLSIVTPVREKKDVSKQDGSYRVDGLTEGLHLVMAESAKALACIPFYVKRVSGGLGDETDDADRKITVPLIAQGAPTSKAIAGVFASTSSGSQTDNASMDFDVAERHNYMVRVTPDGRLLGQVITRGPGTNRLQLAANNNLFLLKDGIRIKESKSDQAGRFQFNGVAPGVYGIVAAGPAGYTAFAFEAGEATVAANSQLSSQGFVIQDAGKSSVLPVVLVPPALLDAAITTLQKGPCQRGRLAPLISPPKSVKVRIRRSGF